MNAKCGSARNRTYVSVLPVGCLNHSTTEPTTLETPPITDLNVVRSDRLGGSEVILIPEERDERHLEPHHNKVNHQLRHQRGEFKLDSQKHCQRI